MTRKPVILAVTRTLIGVLVINALSPLSVLAQDKGYVSPAAQRQMVQLAQLNQKMEAAKAERSRSPADRAGEELKQAQDAAATLRSDQRARMPQTAATKDQRELRAIGPDVRVEVQRRPSALSAQQRNLQTDRLKGHLQAVREGQSAVRAEFDATGRALAGKRLPTAILERHQVAVAQFEQRSAEFDRLSAAWLQTQSDASLTALADFFERYPAQRKAAPFDPKQLPWGTPKPTKREPATTKTAWFQQLWGQESVRLAQSSNVGPIQFQVPPEPGQAPTEADLAQTPETLQSAAVQAQAQQLGRNPLSIHNWVRNNIEWVPTWGAIQSADDTLAKKRGNAHDIASLEIALLRASNIPARYQYGTVELDADKANNWIGGTSVPEATLQLLGQGGIANRGIASGGRITKVQMEHVWVQAYVNWAPSRGAKQGNATQHVNPIGPANAWVVLDPSYKQYTYSAGLNLRTAVPLDANALLTAAQQGATVNQAEGWVQNLNQAAIQSQLTDYQNRLRTYIDSQSQNATVGDVIGRKIIPQNQPSLIAGALPYAVVQSGQQATAIPQTMRWQMRLALFAAQGGELLSHTLALHDAVASKISLMHEPAAIEDAELINDFSIANGTRYPAYLVRLQPVLRVENQVVQRGPTIGVGERETLEVSLIAPAGEISRSYQLTSGDYSAIAATGHGVDAEQFARRSEATDLSLGSQADLPSYVSEALYQTGLGWWALKDSFERALARQLGVVKVNLPSHTLISSSTTVGYFFGVPTSASYSSSTMDAKLDRLSVVPAAAQDAAGIQAQRAFLRAAGAIGSYLEGAIFEMLGATTLGTGASTISLLNGANVQGIRVYELRTSNAAQLGVLELPIDVIDEIAGAVHAGLTVFAPQSDVTLGGYRGVGYLIEDTESGSAAYQIDGGRSGGSSAGTRATVVPVPIAKDTPLLRIITRGVLQRAGAAMVVDGGVVVGIALGGAAVIVAEIIALILAAILIYTLITQAIQGIRDETYPRMSRLFRHYTKAMGGIVATGYLIATDETGSYGPGVYVADAVDEAQRGVGCPPNAVDVVTRFQLPRPGALQLDYISGFVEIEVKRDNYVRVDGPYINTVGQPEYVFRSPVAPIVHPVNGRPAFALLFVPDFVELHDVCF